MINRLRKHAYWMVSAVLVLAFLLSAFIAGTYGWSSYQNHKTNEATGMPILTQVILQKLEKTPDGAATDRIVPGAEFYLYKVGDPDDVQIGGRYVTDQNGQIRLQGLTNGQYFFLETRPGYGFTFDQDEKGDPITRYDFTVTGLEVNNRLTVTAYNRRQLGPLTIGKLVENADGSPLTDAQKALEFAFTVSFSDGGTYAYRIDGGELQTVGDGGIIKLKHGQNAVFENIPVGVEYKVEEAVFPGYTVRSENHQGEIVAAGCHVLFTNTSAFAPIGTSSLVVEKQVDGEVPASEAGRTFQFVLEVEGLEPQSFTLQAGESIELKNLPAGAGYTLSEVNVPDGYALTGVIGGSGTLDLDTVTARFTNTFKETVTRPIEGEKTWDLQGYQPELPDSVLIYLKKGGVVVDTAVVGPDGNGRWTYRFDPPKYEPDGVTEIQYTIEEAPIPHFRPSYNGMDVRNTYIPPVTVESPPVEKSIEGDKAPPVTFQFVMTARHNAPMPEESAQGRKTIQITGAGTAGFGPITYTEPGVYTYEITEQNAGAGGWTYDPAVYTYTVVVEERDGALSVTSRTLSKDGEAADKALFINRYVSLAGKDKVEIIGTKTWEYGEYELSYYPEAILVYVKVGDTVVAQRTVTAADHWTYIFRLPKYDDYGREIIYSIDEEPVPGYLKTVDGYDLINTFDPDDPYNIGIFEKSEKYRFPKNDSNVRTGDDSRPGLWIFWTGLSLTGLLIAGRRRSRRQKAKSAKRR